MRTIKFEKYIQMQCYIAADTRGSASAIAENAKIVIDEILKQNQCSVEGEPYEYLVDKEIELAKAREPKYVLCKCTQNTIENIVELLGKSGCTEYKAKSFLGEGRLFFDKSQLNPMLLEIIAKMIDCKYDCTIHLDEAVDFVENFSSQK